MDVHRDMTADVHPVVRTVEIGNVPGFPPARE